VSEQPDFARAWLQQRRSGEQALEQLAIDDLRLLDDQTALRHSEALLAATPIAEASASRQATSGFVEQQRLFLRARR
jgi:hypothetical protein